MCVSEPREIDERVHAWMMALDDRRVQHARRAPPDVVEQFVECC
jgi:hypothetical protein